MKLRIVILALLLLVIPAASASDVNVGVYVLNLGKFDVATGSFTVDFYMSMKCMDTCPSDQFEFMNGRAATVEKTIDKPNEKFYRIQANLNSPVNLKDFPFDAQQMQIILEDKTHTIEEVSYTINHEESGIDDSIAFTGWNIDRWDASVREHEYNIYGEKFSQYVFTIDISRIVWNSFLKTFLPVIFIVLVVLFSFLLDPDKISQRLTMAGSSLVASVMFHISITNQIPPLGYLTFADKFMILTYFVLLATFIINMVLLELLEQKKQDLVERVHRATEYSMFIAVPLLYVLLFIFF